MNRKTFLKSAFGTAITLSGVEALARKMQVVDSFDNSLNAAPAFTLPPLPYANNALEPSIDAFTMEIHHDRHHKAYVDNLNKAVDGTPLAKLPIEQILRNVSKHPVAVRNNAGGHWNHSFFWKILAPTGTVSNRPFGSLAEALDQHFGSDVSFRDAFKNAAVSRFGSGWAWLIVDKNKKLLITTTPNQDNPLMDVAEVKGTPILALDVWEHAYYLKYQNLRADYVDAFWRVLNWEQVNNNYEAAMK